MIELIIEKRRRDIGGGFDVGRMLPSAKQRMVGLPSILEGRKKDERKP